VARNAQRNVEGCEKANWFNKRWDEEEQHQDWELDRQSHDRNQRNAAKEGKGRKR
jgi:hypothetical protein